MMGNSLATGRGSNSPVAVGGAVDQPPGAGTARPGLKAVDWLLILHVLSLPFMAYAPVALGGKSIVLPYLTSALLLPTAFRLRSRLAISRPVLALLLWLAWVGLGFAAVWLAGQLTVKAVTQFVNILIMVVQFLALRALFVRGGLQRLARLKAVFTLVAVLVAAYALYEFAAVQFGLPFRYDIPLRNANTFNVRLDPVQTPLFVGFAPARVMSITPEPSFLGCYFAAVLAWMLPELLSLKQGVLRVGFAIIFAGLVLTFSRIGWLAFGGMLIYALARLKGHRNLRAVLAICFAVGACGILVLVEGQVSRFTTINVAERFLGNTVALSLLREHPLLGVGVGGYQAAATDTLTRLGVYDPGLQGAYLHAYSLYAAWGAETGVVGLLLFLAFLFVIRRGLIHVQAATRERQVNSLAQGLEFSLVAILLGWLANQAYNLSYIWFILAVAASLPIVAKRLPARVAPSLRRGDTLLSRRP